MRTLVLMPAVIVLAAAAVAAVKPGSRATGADARAQASYPTPPVHVIVDFAAGGRADISTRLLAQRPSELLGQQSVVENRTGAASNIGAELLAKASADGYTLFEARFPPQLPPRCTIISAST